MAHERSSEYRGATREDAESAYHADARTMARMGYAPASEDWSSVVEEVLTVRYVHAPELRSAVLEAVAMAEAEQQTLPRRAKRPSAARNALRRVVGRGLTLFDRLTTELKVTVGAIAGLAAGISLWSLIGPALYVENAFMLFISLFTLGFAGGLAGATVTLRRELRRSDGGT